MKMIKIVYGKFEFFFNRYVNDMLVVMVMNVVLLLVNF